MVRTLVTCALTILLLCNVHAQLFTDITSDIGGLPSAPTRFYGGGISFFDVNEDGLDDLTIPVSNDTLILRLSAGGGFQEVPLFFISGEMKMPLWGDYDNDGDNDIYVPVYLGQSRLYRNEGNWNFTDVTFSSGVNIINNWKCFGANWLDYNNDGWLDLFQTVYTENLEPPRNTLLQGSASGMFTDVSMTTGVRIGSAWSLSACVIDFDHDGDQDIHVANDKPTIDAFLMNQGPWFVNYAQTIGFDVNCNSMSSSVTDYDHDGEYDIFVSNTINLPNLIYKKNASNRYDPWVFPEVDINRLSWGGLWIDADNDSWDELHIAHEPFEGDEQAFFYNINGDLQRGNFTEDGETFYTYAMAKGDFNGDGFYDMANAPYDDLPNKLYLNQGGANNFLRLRFEGQTSNRNGIGARIHYWINGHEVLRYTRSSDAYMTQDSQWMILGLGEATSVDSLQITWLGGQVDKYYNIQANQHLVIQEGNPLELFVLTDEMTDQNNTLHVCQGDSTILTSSNNQPVLWSNGMYSSSITVVDAGTYSYAFFDPLNEMHHSDEVTVEWIEQPNFSGLSSNPTCWNNSDGSIELEIPEQWHLQWNGALISDSLFMDGLPAGNYSFSLVHNMGCAQQWSISMEAPDSLNWSVSILDATCADVNDGQIIISDISGGTGTVVCWLDSLLLETNMATNVAPGNYNLTMIDENGCWLQSAVEVEAPDVLEVEMEFSSDSTFLDIEITGGTWPYWFMLNDSLLFSDQAVQITSDWNYWSLSDAHGCALADSFYITPEVIISALNIDQESQELVLNSSGEGFYNGGDPMVLELFDNSGKLISVQTVNTGSFRLPYQAKGVYLVRWRKDKKVLSKKFYLN